MHLIIGGNYQGKLNYAKSLYGEEVVVADGAIFSPVTGEKIEILDHLHLWIRSLMCEGKDAEQLILSYLKGHPDLIVICDEIGAGPVPVDSFERRWREVTGRILCVTAAMADQVDRIYCGLVETLKGGKKS